MFSIDWVDGVLRRHNLWGEFKKQRILLFWERAVGSQTALVSQAERFSDGTLWVAVSSPTVAQELSFFEARYIQRLNDLLGEDILRKIRFIPGQFKKVIPKARVTLSAVDYEEAHKLFSSLGDPKLRESFERLLLALRKREAAFLSAGGKRCPHCGVVFIGEQETCPGCCFGRD